MDHRPFNKTGSHPPNTQAEQIPETSKPQIGSAALTDEELKKQDLVGWILRHNSSLPANPLDRRAYNGSGPLPPSKEAERESSQPYSGNPLDRGAYDKRATYKPKEMPSDNPLQRNVEALDDKIRLAEAASRNVPNITPQQIDANVAALRAERDTAFKLYQAQKDSQYNGPLPPDPNRPTFSNSSLEHDLTGLDDKIKYAEAERHNVTDRTPQQIDAHVAALKAERDSLYKVYRAQKDSQYNAPLSSENK